MAMGSCGKILVAEDDGGMREALESLLEAAGIASTTYASAEALLAGGELDDARCVISDLRLPLMSGLELLTTLRLRPRSPPVIMITGHDAAGVRAQALRLGAADYLTKPFQGGALLAAITNATQSSGNKP